MTSAIWILICGIFLALFLVPYPKDVHIDIHDQSFLEPNPNSSNRFIKNS